MMGKFNVWIILFLFNVIYSLTNACYYYYSSYYGTYRYSCYNYYYYYYYYYYNYTSYSSSVGVIVGAVIGGIIGFIILVSIIIVICIAVCKKSTGMRGTVIRPSQPAVSATSASNQQNFVGYHHPQQLATAPYPPEYTPTATADAAYPPPPPPPVYSY